MVPISRLRSPRHSHHHRTTASKSSSTSKSSLDKHLPPPPPPPPPPSENAMTTVLVGAKQLPFSVNRQLLCDASPFFSERLQEDSQPKPICLWLPSESSTMFGLFVAWVHSPGTFRRFLDHSVSSAHETSERAVQDIHWAIIRLHLFASHLDLYKLQDLAMDAVQDLYLKCDWDVPPSLIIYLYTQCEALPSVRVRRWAVAMVAFSLTVDNNHDQLKFHPQDSATSDPARFRELFASLPDFANDYATHVRNMKAAGLEVRFKNPQLRISANKLRNDERLFGFRECSFHSHRAAVGEKRCPYNEGRGTSKHPFEMGLGLGDVSGAGAGAGGSGGADLMPEPLFSSAEQQETLRHLRSISSGMKEG